MTSTSHLESDNESLPDLSFVVPAFNEEGNVGPFYEACVQAMEGRGHTLEVLYVDDGSRDKTFAEICRVGGLSREQDRVAVRGISFSRNFGKEAALYAGLEHAGGRCICFIDGDLQQRPETALEMYDRLLADDELDCVAAYQERRTASPLIDWCSSKFYGILAGSSGMDVVSNASDFRVFRRSVAQALLDMPERYRFSKGLFAWVGFKTEAVPYVPESRLAGETSWSFTKLVKYALGGLMSFTTVPLRAGIYLGVLVSLAALVYMVVVVVQALAFGIDVPGYATIVVLVLFLGGVQLLVLGVMGEYIARSYMQGKGRPIYIERREVGFEAARGKGAPGDAVSQP